MSERGKRPWMSWSWWGCSTLTRLYSQRSWWLQIQPVCPPSALSLPFKPLFCLTHSLWVTARYNTHDASPSFEELFSTLQGIWIFSRIFLLNLTQFCATLWKGCQISETEHLQGVLFPIKYRKRFFNFLQTALHNLISCFTWSGNCTGVLSKLSNFWHWWFDFKISGYLSILEKSIEKVKATFMAI